MEVLEHVVALDTVIERLWRVLADDGTLIVSVPVETGLPLLLKQAARRVAGWRGIGDYPGTSPYTLREYCASVFAGARPHLARPSTASGRRRFTITRASTGWRSAIDSRSDFAIERTVASPFSWLGPHLATQVWFVARKKSV